MKPALKKLALFLLIWLTLGFSMIAAVLIGPVGWLTDIFRAYNVSQEGEDLTIKIVILIFILISAVVSSWLTEVVLRTSKKVMKFGIPLATILLAAVVQWLWFNPHALTGGGLNVFGDLSRFKDAKFTFGPYPTKEHLFQLKKAGYTDVISLLHPSVVPFELKLLEDEKKAADKVGINVIHVPMLPWVSENEDAIARIKDIAANGKGRYYVHCYLGKHRVNVVKRVLEQHDVPVAAVGIEPGKPLDEIESFERGRITKLEKGVYFIPYPTDEEFFGYILAGDVKKIVSILNPSDPDNELLIAKERKLAELYQIPFELLPIDMKHFDPQRVREVIEKVKSSPKPLVVHDFRSDSEAGKMFIQMFRDMSGSNG